MQQGVRKILTDSKVKNVIYLIYHDKRTKTWLRITSLGQVRLKDAFFVTYYVLRVRIKVYTSE